MTERLDDLAALAANDPSGMLEAVLGLGAQCREGYRSGLEAADLPSGDGVTAVAICGMGGSGVSGDVIRALYRERLTVPVTVAKGPVLPAFCGKDTLVVVSSYSGGTAETLACFDEASAWGCRLVAVTSGGELGRRAAEQGVAVVPVPAGFQPRAAVGHLAFGVLGALEAMGVIPTLGDEVAHVAAVLERLRNRIGPEAPLPENPAKQLAAAIGDRFPVLWGADGVGGVAAGRWRTELNENAKVPAFSAALPELDHNEVVGWSAGTGERFVLLTLRHPGEHPDVAARFPVSVEVALSAGLQHHEVRADGDTPLSSLMSLVMLGGAVSVYLAALRGVDPTPIDAITRIKRALEEYMSTRSIEPPAEIGAASPSASASASAEAASPGDTAAEEAVAAIRSRSSVVPSVAIILGSGLGPAADLIEQDAAFSFADLPGFPAPTVPGHAGRLLVGTLAGVPVAAFMGRIHFYEGHPMSVSTMPVRVARLMGAEIMVLTASVGALDPALQPGSLVVATDHLNMMGENPLRGWRNADGSPPFVDVSSLYDAELRDIALEEAPAAGLTAAPGVYVAASGPSYETRAEIEMMRDAGGTVVGMSIVPEALPARALGMRLLGLFSVTNSVGGEVSHLEVIEVGRQMGSNLAKLLERVVPRIAATAGAPH